MTSPLNPASKQPPSFRAEEGLSASGPGSHPIPSGTQLLTRQGHSLFVSGLLAEGGMADVYLAHWEAQQADVCVKFPRLYALERFQLREIPAALTIRHPHVVQHLDVGDYSGSPFLMMEYVSGLSLSQWMGRQASLLPWPQALNVTRQIAEGLVAIHSAGIVHRDLSASNVLYDLEQERAVILDFGLARFDVSADELTRVSQGVNLLGTFACMSPEQAADPRRATAQSDLYSLGCLLFFLLTRQRPFPEATTNIELLQAHAKPSRPNVRQYRADHPQSVDDLLKQLLAVDTTQRPGSARKVVEFIEHILSSAGSQYRSPSPRRKFLVHTALAGAALTVPTGAWLLHSSWEKTSTPLLENQAQIPQTPNTTVFAETFAASALNPDRWEVMLPSPQDPAKHLFPASQVTLVQGKLSLRNRGYLVTRQEFSANVRLCLKWMWQPIQSDLPSDVGVYADHLAIALHTTGKPKAQWAYDIVDGLVVKFYAGINEVEIIDGFQNERLGIVRNIALPQWTWHELCVEDSGAEIRVYCNSAQPILQVPITNKPHAQLHKIAIYNREPVAMVIKESLIEDLIVQDCP